MQSKVLQQTINSLTQDVTQRDVMIKALQLTIEKLKIELTHLKRMRYGRSSEKMDSAQAQLELLSAALAPLLPAIAPAVDTGDSNVADLDAERKKRSKKFVQPQQGLPAHLPREEIVHSSCAADCKCGACGTGLRQIGQDVSEVLDYAPGSFKVIRHIRPKFACTQCHSVTQALAPSRPINRCMAGAGLLAQACWRRYWSANTATTRRCTVKAKSTPALALILSAPPSAIGWPAAPACWSRWCAVCKSMF